MMNREKEYESLRKEILEWQNRRFTVASGGLVAVSAIIGFILNKPDAFSWMIASGFILWVISIASILSYYLGLSATKISTYIEIFYESEIPEMCWERRQKNIKQTSSKKKFFLIVFLCWNIRNCNSIFGL